MDSAKLTIKEWRAIKGVSEEELAVICKVSSRTITNWEKHPGSIKAAKLVALSNALGVDLNEIRLE